MLAILFIPEYCRDPSGEHELLMVLFQVFPLAILSCQEVLIVALLVSKLPTTCSISSEMFVISSGQMEVIRCNDSAIQVSMDLEVVSAESRC